MENNLLDILSNLSTRLTLFMCLYFLCFDKEIRMLCFIVLCCVHTVSRQCCSSKCKLEERKRGREREGEEDRSDLCYVLSMFNRK